MKHLVLSSILAIASLSGAAFADDTIPSCPHLRDAQATMVVYKATFTLQNGVWVSHTDEVGRSQTTVPVVDGTVKQCNISMTGLLRLDNIPVNGKLENLNVHAWVISTNRTNPVYISKRFAASYWLSSDNGRQGWAAADSEDLKLEKIRVNMNAESASTTPTAHSDILTIQVSFDDNAQ